MNINICESRFTTVLNIYSLPAEIATVLCDCLLIVEAVVDIIKVMACFLVQVTLAVAHAVTFGFGKLFVNTVYWILWILFHFTCGILGLEDKSTSAFSWLLLVLMLFVYCDRSHHDWFIRFLRMVSLYDGRHQGRLWNNEAYNERHQERLWNNAAYNDVILENQRNEHREIEPINRQREMENQENENEENDLVEAARQRVDIDNQRNMARENGVDNHRATIENRQNVERERQNTRTSLENWRNRTQEQHRYFLRQRNRVRYTQGTREDGARHGVEAVVLPGQSVINILQPNGSLLLVRRHRGLINNSENTR